MIELPNMESIDTWYMSTSDRDYVTFVLGSVGIHREFITAAARWIMEAKL